MNHILPARFTKFFCQREVLLFDHFSHSLNLAPAEIRNQNQTFFLNYLLIRTLSYWFRSLLFHTPQNLIKNPPKFFYWTSPKFVKRPKFPKDLPYINHQLMKLTCLQWFNLEGFPKYSVIIMISANS